MCVQAACVCFEGDMRTRETPDASVGEGDLAVKTGSPSQEDRVSSALQKTG